MNTSFDLSSRLPPATPTLTLKSSAGNGTIGQSVQLTGTVNPPASGEVTLTQSVNGSAPQFVANVSLTNGAYSYQYNLSAAGNYTFQARFVGNAQLYPANSSTVTVSSKKAAPIIPEDYTWYAVGGVVLLVAIILAAYYMKAVRPRASRRRQP